MIEITYHTSEEAGESVVIKPPKNIRQIGSPRGRHKIYVEDYVHTYLHSSLFFGESQQRAAILLGRSEVSQDIRYTFIEGAINCEDFVFQKDGIIFDESCWTYIYQEMKQYFDQQVIVGWFLGRSGFPLKVSHTVEAAQRKYFSGRDKVLCLWDPQEGEEAFFAYEQGSFQKKEGYYIYYEKNLAMQEYMVCQREKAREEQGGIQEILEDCGQDEEVEIFVSEAMDSTKEDTPSEEKVRSRENGAADVAIGNYRNMLKKREIKQPLGGKNLFLYGAATVALIAICISGVVNLNSYQKMKQMEEALTMMTNPLEGQQSENGQDERQITVQTVSGDVNKQDEASKENGDGADEGQEQGNVPEGQEEQGTVSQQPESQENSGQSQENGQESPEQQSAGQTDSGQQPEDPTANAQQPEDSQQAEDSQEAMVQSYLDQGYYVVQPGDSLESICRKIYQSTDMMQKLCEVNQIADINKILVGQKLILP